MTVCAHCGKVLYVPECEKSKYNFANGDIELLEGLLEKNFSICTECLQPYNDNKMIWDRKAKDFCMEIVNKYVDELKKKPNCYYCSHSRHTVNSMPTSCDIMDKGIKDPKQCKGYKFSKNYAKDYLQYMMMERTDIWTKLYLNHIIKWR